MNPTANSPAPGGGLPPTPEQKGKKGASFRYLLETFQDSTSFVISVSAFSAALFSIAVGQFKDPRDVTENPRFDMQTVRVFISIAWLSFALCLTIVGFSISFLKVLDKDKRAEMNTKLWQPVGILVWSLLYGLITLAFMFLSLALVAYVGVVGWISFGFACLVGIMSVIWVVLESRAVYSA